MEDFLKDPSTAEEYKVALANRFKVLQELYDEDEGVDINSQWSHIKDAVNTTYEEIIGRKKTPTERLDFSRNNEENTDLKRQEGSSQQQPHKGVKGNSSERAHSRK